MFQPKWIFPHTTGLFTSGGAAHTKKQTAEKTFKHIFAVRRIYKSSTYFQSVYAMSVYILLLLKCYCLRYTSK